MNTLTDNKIKVAIKKAAGNSLPRQLMLHDVMFEHKKKLIAVRLRNNYTMIFPLTEFPLLLKASVAQREHWRLIAGGVGVHWPELDEDLSVKGFIQEHIRKSKSFIARNELVVG